MTPTNMTPELLDRYLAGEANAAERDAVERWMETDTVRGDLVMALRQRGHADTEAWLHRVRNTLADNGGLRASMQPDGAQLRLRKTGEENRALRFGSWRGWMGLGGALLALLAVAFIAHNQSPTASTITRAYTTTTNQQATLNLDDGSRIMLAPNTAVRLMHFGRLSRNVVLDRGEAYFEVARGTGNPFVVRTGNAVLSVLGTGFLVRQDAAQRHVTVSVDEGKIRVMSAAHRLPGVTLTAGQIGDVEDSTVHVSAVDDLVPGVEQSPGQLVFHDIPVATILRTVSRWYGYQFRYADQTLAQRPVTIVISTQSSAEALATIEHVLSVGLTVTGDTITLTPRAARALRSAPGTRTYNIWNATREVGR